VAALREKMEWGADHDPCGDVNELWADS
jgi:hypothetical protein